ARLAEDLDGHDAAAPSVLRAPDVAHAARPRRPLDFEAAVDEIRWAHEALAYQREFWRARGLMRAATARATPNVCSQSAGFAMALAGHVIAAVLVTPFSLKLGYST